MVVEEESGVEEHGVILQINFVLLPFEKVNLTL